MFPARRALHPSIVDAMDLSRPTGRRGHRHAGSMTSALTPIQAGMVRFKGGGGVGGILKSVAIGAALGALTGGIGFALFEMGATFSSTALGIAAGTWQSAVVGGAIMGSIGGTLAGAGGMMGVRA